MTSAAKAAAAKTAAAKAAASAAKAAAADQNAVKVTPLKPSRQNHLAIARERQLLNNNSSKQGRTNKNEIDKLKIAIDERDDTISSKELELEELQEKLDKLEEKYKRKKDTFEDKVKRMEQKQEEMKEEKEQLEQDKQELELEKQKLETALTSALRALKDGGKFAKTEQSQEHKKVIEKWIKDRGFKKVKFVRGVQLRNFTQKIYQYKFEGEVELTENDFCRIYESFVQETLSNQRQCAQTRAMEAVKSK